MPGRTGGLLEILPFKEDIPSDDTLRRFVRALSPEAFGDALSSLCVVSGRKRPIGSTPLMAKGRGAAMMALSKPGT